MNAREYLSQLRSIDRRIKDKIEESQRWRDIAENTTSRLSDVKVQTSPKVDKMADAITLAVQCERESAELALELAEKKRTIIAQIDGMDRYYDILKMYFLFGYTMNRISVEIDRSYKQANRDLKDGIQAFADKYGDTF